MRLLFAGITLSLLLAGCGGSNSSTITPSAEPTSPSLISLITATPAAIPGSAGSATGGVPACIAEHLAGELGVGGVAAGTAYYSLLVNNTVPQGCTVSGPPTISFIDSAGSGFLVDVGADSPCGTGPVDPSLCVDHQAIELAPAGEGSLAQMTVTVAIANAINFIGKRSPTRQAQAIVLKFPGTSGVVIPLDQDITLIPGGQVFLFGYGPSKP